MSDENTALREPRRGFDPSWIKVKINQACINYCRDLAEQLAGKRDNEVSKTSLRNIFNEVKRIENNGFKGGNAQADFFQLLPRLAYTESRFTENQGGAMLKLFRKEFEKAHAAVDTEAEKSEAQFSRFVKYLEAVLAFHYHFENVNRQNRKNQRRNGNQR